MEQNFQSNCSTTCQSPRRRRENFYYSLSLMLKMLFSEVFRCFYNEIWLAASRPQIFFLIRIFYNFQSLIRNFPTPTPLHGCLNIYIYFNIYIKTDFLGFMSRFLNVYIRYIHWDTRTSATLGPEGRGKFVYFEAFFTQITI